MGKTIDTRLAGIAFLLRLKVPFASGRKTQIVACSNCLRLRAKSLDSAGKSGTNEEDAYEAGMMALADADTSDANDLKFEDFGKTAWACWSCRVACLAVQKYTFLPRERHVWQPTFGRASRFLAHSTNAQIRVRGAGLKELS